MNAKEFEDVLHEFRDAIKVVKLYLPVYVLAGVWQKLDKHRLEMQEAEAATCSRCGIELCGHGQSFCPACCLSSDPVSACHEAAQVGPGMPGIPDSEPSDDARPSWIRLDRIEKRLDEIEGRLEHNECNLNVDHKRLGEIERKATEQRIAPTLAHAQVHYDALLRRLADMPTNQPEAKPAFERASTEMHDTAVFTPTNAQLREGARESGNLPPGPPWDATDNPFTPEPAAPIEVEMRVRTGAIDSSPRQCECLLGGGWIEVLEGCTTNGVTRTIGNAWLASLSEQLGVPLVAKWEGEKPMPSFSKDATAKRQERRASGRQSDCSDAPCPPPASG